MQNKTTLYDILEVSANASQTAIHTSYERLKTQFLDDRLDSKGMEPKVYFQLVKDAYTTLSDEARRQAYDQKVFGRGTPAIEMEAVDPLQSGGIPAVVKWALILALALGGGMYYKTARDAERAAKLEQARLEAEQKAAELAVAERMKEQDEARRQRELAREEAMQEARRQQEFEAARRESERVSMRLEQAHQESIREDERKKREAERVAQREEYQRQRQAEEAQRRIEREKALARQLEQENRSTGGRVSVIASPTSQRPYYAPDPRDARR